MTVSIGLAVHLCSLAGIKLETLHFRWEPIRLPKLSTFHSFVFVWLTGHFSNHYHTKPIPNVSQTLRLLTKTYVTQIQPLAT